MIDLDQIKPKLKGESDKYSWNLYRFMDKLYRKRPEGKFIKKQLEIHWLHNSRWDGSHLEFDENNILLNQILIVPFGRQSNRGGSFYSMAEVMRKGYAEHFALPSSYKTSNITDWFFNTYIKDGGCIFDRRHNGWWQGEKERYTVIKNTRRCNWCGEWHKKEIKKEVEIKRREIWV